ncbi:MAG: DUF1631 family protein [Burkholderiaceae bacterium]|nr:DUF1631 family protein [Burkholderiaceae bacterium]
MVTGAAFQTLAGQARRLYTEELVKGLAGLVQDACETAKALLDKPSEHGTMMRRRDLVQNIMKLAPAWHRGMVGGLRNALLYGVSASRVGEFAPSGGSATVNTMSLVDDDTIELEIMTSRLALAIMDRASWEFSDLRSRIVHLEQRGELEPQDLLRAHVLARIVVDAWRGAGLTQTDWREMQPVLHEEFAHLTEACYHETNRWLVERHVLPDVDLRPFIRRNKGVSPGAGAAGQGNERHSGFATSSQFPADERGADSGFDRGSGGGRPRGYVGEETRMMTRAGPLPRSSEHVEAVLGRLNRLVGRHVPNFLAPTSPRALSPALSRAIDTAQAGIRQRLTPDGRSSGADAQVTAPVMLDELHQRRQTLKRAAATPEERATIEIVALLFQSILTEDRIPAAIRVWFARLQMPVLRVAVSEPDFFATVDHPARRLIDRMGACVLGFDSSTGGNVGDALAKEIKRIVQVVEAYPDTGRRVFQTVLTEFEKFLEHWFKNENEASRKGVSLAQQVEQRETMAIQYTIELRRMLNEVPVQDGVRQFLFQVWADVLATCGVRHGAQSDQTKAMKRAAADLIWSASAKVTREERAEVIRRLPALLKALREGMGIAGIEVGKQDEHIRQLNDSLAAAFTAKAAVIPHERLQEMMERLETLEELLPDAADAADMAIDESMMLDLSGHESADLEIVTDGGSMPTQAMVAWARELQVGSWYMLDYRGRNEPVQLAWQGLRKQLSLFAGTNGRCVLFQQQRLASFLQAGLLLPAQDEALTVRATRSALAKLDVDASVLGSSY